MGSGASQPSGAGGGSGEGHDRKKSLMGSLTLRPWKHGGDAAKPAAPNVTIVEVEETIMPSDRDALATTRFSLSPLSAALLRDPSAAPLHLAFVECIDSCFTLWSLAVRGRSMWAAHFLAHLKTCETEVTRVLHEKQKEERVLVAIAQVASAADPAVSPAADASSSPFGAAAHVAARIKDMASMAHLKSWAHHGKREGAPHQHAALPLDEPQRAAFVTLIERIHASQGLLSSVLARPPFLSLVFAQKDAAALEQARVEIERLKAAVLHSPSESAADPDPVDPPLHTSIIMSSLLEELSHEREGALRRGAAQHVQGISEVRIRINPPAAAAAAAAAPPTAPAPIATPAAPASPQSQAPASPPAPLTSFKLLRGAPLAVTVLSSIARDLPALEPLVPPLSALYSLWSTATNRTSWLAEFYALLHGLECGFSGAVSRAIQDAVFLRAVAAILVEFQEPLETICSRSRFLGVALGSADRVILDSMRDRLLELQRTAVSKLLARQQQESQWLEPSHTEALRSMAAALDSQETQAIQSRLNLAAERAQEDALRSLLHPIDYALEIEAERAAYCMGTRCAIIERVQEWIEAPLMPPVTHSDSAAAAALPSASSSSSASFVPPSRVFWLRGEPGLGKTTLSCVFLESFPRFFGAVHLCRHDLESRRSPARLIKSIVFQLAGRLAPFKRALMKRLALLQNEVPSASAAELWDLLLVQTCAIMKADAGPPPSDAALASLETQAALDPSTPVSLAHLLSGQQRLCVLIDALDECVDGKVSGGGGGGGSNSLLQLLAAELGKLPPWLCFLVTSRPEPDIERALSRHAGNSRISLSITDPENNTDVEVYLRQEVSAVLRLRDQPPQQLQQQLEQMDLTPAVQALSDKSKGHFLYARLIIERLADIQSEREKAQDASSSSSLAAPAASYLTPDDFAALPEGLSALYLEHMQRLSASLDKSKGTSMELVRAVLEIILCSFEPLSLVSLAKLTDLPSEAALRALVAPLCEGGLFQLQTQSESDPAAKVRYQLALRAARAARRPAPPPDFCGAQQLDYTICLPFHKSIVDWLTDPARLLHEHERQFYVTANKGHRRMRSQCFEELTLMHEEDFSNAASSPAASSAAGSNLAPFLCVDRAANPDTYLASSSLLSYVLRFGPKHCLAAWSTSPLKDAAAASASEVLPAPGSEAFLTRFPFLPAAQFLVHLQYLQMRAALRGDLASLALEYASCVDSGDEWERIVREAPEIAGAGTAEATDSASSNSSSDLSISWLWLSSPSLALQALRDFRFLIRLELKNWRGVGPAELWDVVASESAAEAEMAKQARLNEQSDGKRLMAGSSSKKALVSVADANRSVAVVPTLDCYAASGKAMSRFCCGSIASQFLYSSALSFPESSCVRSLGSARFDSWFLSWHLRRVHRAQWINKPQMLPNLLASLQHSSGGAGGGNAAGAAGSNSSGEQSTVAAHAGSLTSLKIHVLSFSPDGLKIASVCALDRAVRIFHAVSFELLQLIIPSAAASAFTPTTLAWTGDSELLAVGGYRSPLSLYTAEGGEHVGNTLGSALRGVESCVFIGVRGGGAAAASNTAQRESFAILAGYSNDLDIYSLSAAASSAAAAAFVDSSKAAAPSLRSFGSSVHQSRVTLLRLNSDRTLLASAGWDEYVVVWNMGSPETQAAAAAASEEEGEQAAAVVERWVTSIRPLIVLVPPLSAGLTSRASEVAALVLHFRALAWHPLRRGTLVSASGDRGGNGLCNWEVLDAAAEERAAPELSFVAARNPLRALIQTPEQRWDEYLHASFTPTGSHLFVSARGRTTMDVFAEDLAEEGMQLEWIGVTDVADVGRDVSCMDFSGIHEAANAVAAPGPAAATTKASLNNTASGKRSLRRMASTIAATASLKRVVLLTGDTGGQARVWSVEALLNKVHQELPPMSEVEMPDEVADAADAHMEEEKKEQLEEKAIQAPSLPRTKSVVAAAAPNVAPGVSLDPPVMFPRIGCLACNAQFLVIADASAAPVLHVYNPATAAFLRSIADSVATEMEIQPDAASSKTAREVAELLAAASPPGAVCAMQLADTASFAAASTLAVSYRNFRGIKLWDIARGVLLRVVGFGLVSAAVPSLAFNPRSMAQMQQEQERAHSSGKHGSDGTMQLLAPEGNLLSLWALPLPPLPLGVRTLFLKPGRAQKDSGRRKAAGSAVELQHVSSIIAAAFHPQATCIASIESTGVLKLWQPGVSDSAAKQAAATAASLSPVSSAAPPALPLHWDKHATILRTHTASQEQVGIEGVEFTCLSFSPNGSLLAVGGLNPCLTLFDTRSAPGSAGSSGSSGGRGFGKVRWKIVAGDTIALSWSPCSRWLATVDRRHTVSIWRIPRAMVATTDELAVDAATAAAKQAASSSRWGADSSDDSKNASSDEEDEDAEADQDDPYDFRAKDNDGLIGREMRLAEENAAREAAATLAAAEASTRAPDLPVLCTQYINQSLSSGMPILPLSSYVFLALTGSVGSGGAGSVASSPSSLPPSVWFHHAEENCIKVWRAPWMEQPDAAAFNAGNAAAATAAVSAGSIRGSRAAAAALARASSLAPVLPVVSAPPLSIPILFHSDRLSSSAQPSLIHFLEHQ